MKSFPGRLAALGVVLLATVLPAQLTVCSGVNHVNEFPHQDFVLPGNARLAAQFTPESPLSIERVEWLFSSVTPETVTVNTTNYGAGAGIVEIRPTDPATGLPSDTVLGSGSYVDAQIGGGIAIFPVGGWHGATFSGPVVLSNAVPYWITFLVGPPVNQIVQNPESFLAVDITPTEPTPYTTMPNGATTWSPVQTDQFFKFRLMSTNCAVTGPVATVLTVGSGCGGATLTSIGTPALGSPLFGIQVHAAANAPAAIFIGQATAAAGIPLSSSCVLRLDPASLGPAPFLSGITDSAGNLALTTSVPVDPALAGAHACLQAAALVPNGPVGIGMAGYGLALTQALDVTVGY